MANRWTFQETLISCILCQSCWMQIITSEASSPTKAYIEFFDPPSVVSEDPVVEVLYQCERPQVVHVDVLASSISKPLVGIFKRRWTCSTDGPEKLREIRLKFPAQVVFREDWILRRPIYVTEVLLRAWISDRPILKLDRLSYNHGVVKIIHPMEILPPNKRPYKDHRRCLQWDEDLLWRLRMEKVPRCPAEQEVLHLLPFLYACTGEGYGILRKPQPYMDLTLERQRQNRVLAPRCSFSVWLYVTDACPVSLCGVFYHLDDSKDYVTPALLLAKSGHLHVQVQLMKKEAHAFRSSNTLPLNQWCHIMLTLDISWANLTTVCGTSAMSTTYRFPDNVLLSDVSGTFHLGGCKYVHGLRAFYGPSVYYRQKIVSVHRAPPPPIIEHVGLSQWFLKCQAFQDECATRFQHYATTKQRTRPPAGCRDPRRDVWARFLPSQIFPQCSEWDGPAPSQRAPITKLLRKGATPGDVSFSGQLFGRALHRTFLRQVGAPNGLSHIRRSMPLLLQAGCLGVQPALFMASVLFQTGLGVRRDRDKALRFLLVSAQNDDRLSQLSLGHKHHLGVDGFPKDYDLSYAYYANIAYQTITDRVHPNRHQAFVELIRLTDEEVLKQQTKENDDLFMWLRYQAKQGVSSAQHAVSRMLFWGQQGISSNPEVAVKFYEKGATQMKDPVMMYDYGVVLLRGQGVTRDVGKAVEYLEKAANLDFVPALNSLGWYYEQYEKNYQKAVEFWERADELGNPEAPFNLGILYHHGLYPGKPKNLAAAYRYYLKSATRGHIDAAVHVSAFWISGLPGVVDRIPYDAVLWTKWAGEQNGHLGFLLRKALNSYLDQSWPSALLYYVQAAEIGIEIGQFNAAFICELDPDGLVTRYLQIDCEWKYYNLSTQSERPPAYAQIKMGDLFYTPHMQRKRDVPAAVQMYTLAALQREPQGLYNLGILMEEGVSLPYSTLYKLGFNSSICANNFTIIMELYRRCRDHEKEDSYVPCTLALLNAHFQYVWTFHASLLKFSSAAAIALVTTLSLMTVFGRLQNAARLRHLSV